MRGVGVGRGGRNTRVLHVTGVKRAKYFGEIRKNGFFEPTSLRHSLLLVLGKVDNNKNVYRI